MTDFFLNSISAALPMSAVIALLLVLLRLYGRRLSAKCRRAIWLIVILRLCVPFGVQSVPALFEITVPEELTSEAEAAASETVNIPQNLPVPAVYHTAPPPVTVVTPETEPVLKLPPPLEIAAYVYAAGIILSAAYKAVLYAVYICGLNRSLYAAGEELSALYAEICAKHGIKRTPKLCIGKAADSPMLYGFIRPRIVLPESAAALPETALTGILTHELTHYRRRDLRIKLAAAVAVAVNWYNPLVYIAAARLSRECELACDECTLAGFDEESRREYGSVMLGIIKSCKKNSGTLTTRFNPKKNAVKERFTNIMDMTKKKRGIWIIALAAVASVIAGVVIGCTIKTNIDSPTDETSDIDFSGFDFGTVDSIYIKNGHTGEETTVMGKENITVITDFIKKISGEVPISARGRYGFKYAVIFYSGDEKVFSIGFPDTDADGISRFSYGVYESVGGFDYPGYYIMHGADETELNNLMRTLTYDVFVPQPEEFSGKTTVISDKSILPYNTIAEVYQTAAHDKNPHMGWLFSIVRHSGSELISDDDNPGGLYYFATDGVWYYALMRPTDVQADMSDAASAVEYEKLSAMAETVMDDFIAANGLDVYISKNIYIGSALSEDTETIQKYINTLESQYLSVHALIKKLETENNSLLYMLNNQSDKMTKEEKDALREEINNCNNQINQCKAQASEIDNQIKALRARLDNIPDRQHSYDTAPDPGMAPAVETAPPVGEAIDMSYIELLNNPEEREAIVAQMNEILDSYNSGTLPNPIENYAESEPFRVSAVPSGVKLPRSVTWDDLKVYIGSALFSDPPRLPAYDYMYPYHIVLPLGGYWNLCVNAAAAGSGQSENSAIRLFGLSFYYGDSYDSDDLQTYGFTEPYIHRASLDDTVNDVVAERYAGASYQTDWLNREMTFSELKSKLLFANGRYVALAFDIKRENGTESYIFTGADEFDIVGATPYDIFVKYINPNLSLITPSRFLTDKQRSQIYFELIAATGLSDIPTFEQLFAGGNVSVSGGSQPSMRISFTDSSGRKIAVTLIRFTESGEPFSPDMVTEETAWDDFEWKSVRCTIDGKPAGEQPAAENIPEIVPEIVPNVEESNLLDVQKRFAEILPAPDGEYHKNAVFVDEVRTALTNALALKYDFETWLTSGDTPYFKTVDGKLLVLNSYSGVPVRFYGADAVITAAGDDTVTAFVPGISISREYYICTVTLVREDGVLKLDKITDIHSAK